MHIENQHIIDQRLMKSILDSGSNDKWLKTLHFWNNISILLFSLERTTIKILKIKNHEKHMHYPSPMSNIVVPRSHAESRWSAKSPSPSTCTSPFARWDLRQHQAEEQMNMWQYWVLNVTSDPCPSWFNAIILTLKCCKICKTIRGSSYLVMYIISDSNWGGCSLDFARLRTCEWADRFAQSSGYLWRSTRWSHVPRATRSFHDLQREPSHFFFPTLCVGFKTRQSSWITAMFQKNQKMKNLYGKS